MRKKRAALIQSYVKYFNSEEGREVLLDIMDRGCILKPTYSEKDERSCFINEGQRELALYILEMANIDVKKLQKIISQEATNEDKEQDHI